MDCIATVLASLWPLLAITGSLLPKPMAWGYETSKLLNGIAAWADVTTDLYVTQDPSLSTGLSLSTNVGRGPRLPQAPAPLLSTRTRSSGCCRGDPIECSSLLILVLGTAKCRGPLRAGSGRL